MAISVRPYIPAARSTPVSPDQWMASALGAAGKPLFKLNTGGTVGASTAVAATQMLAAGTFRRILCVGYEKHSEGSVQSAITTVGDPVWERAVMAGAIGNFASMASVAESVRDARA